MELKQTIQNDLKNALKDKKETEISVFKMLLSAIINEEIKLNKKDEGLAEEEARRVIKAEAKKRQDAIEAYEKADRPELAAKEKKEAAVLEKYLPEQLSDEEIKKIVDTVINNTGANSARDFGKVMQEVMSQTKGQADGKKVSQVVKECLE